MDYEKTLEELKHMKVETGSFVCLGCGHEHNCSIHGCAILRDAVACIEELKRVLQESEAARAELGKRLAAAQQELDAAIYDLKKLKDCSVCAYLDTDCPHGHCEEGEEFRWRGLKEA